MRDESAIVFLDIAIDCPERWIIGEDVAAVFVFQLHTDVFPNFHCDSAFGKVLVYAADCGGNEISIAKAKRIETGA